MNKEKIQMFECSFNFRNTTKITHSRILVDLKEGFWINRKFELTKGSDGEFFIMPHMITEIEKIWVEK